MSRSKDPAAKKPEEGLHNTEISLLNNGNG